MSTAFLFPGQGAQFVGMARGLCDEMGAAKALFEEASEVLGYDLAKLCFEGPAERLNTTDHSQPALFVASLAALEKLKAESPDVVAGCQATAGLSLGEYTALVFAGVMEFADALRVVNERGRAMQAAAEASLGTMVSILGWEVPQVEELCDQHRGDGTLQIANLLCPKNIVISGDQAACRAAAAAAEAAGAMKTIELAVAGAFHTDHMAPAVEKLTAALAEATLHPPRIKVYMNVDAQVHDDPVEIRSLLTRQIVSPVRWEDSIRGLLAGGASGFYEIGPGRVLRGLMKRIDRKVPCENVEC